MKSFTNKFCSSSYNQYDYSKIKPTHKYNPLQLQPIKIDDKPSPKLNSKRPKLHELVKEL